MRRACRYDTYGGVLVDPASVAKCGEDDDTFRQRLESSVVAWRNDKRRGVWLKLPVAQAGFLKVCARVWCGCCETTFTSLTDWK